MKRFATTVVLLALFVVLLPGAAFAQDSSSCSSLLGCDLLDLATGDILTDLVDARDILSRLLTLF